jgi:hypothetical protein
MPRYAAETTVPSEKSKAEIEATLIRYKASAFTSGWDEEQGAAFIAFRINRLPIKFILPIPPRDAKRFQYRTVRKQSVRATEAQAERAWDQEVRQRWRALLLVVKAKLEAVECNISTIEHEFLAHIVLPGDVTLGEWLDKSGHFEAIRGGQNPLALPPRRGDVIEGEVINQK